MGDGEWGGQLPLKIHPNKEDQGKVGPESNRSYVLLVSIGVSALFWISLFAMLFYLLTK
jgi:hypothetical protein